jgi:hypothetical protein
MAFPTAEVEKYITSPAAQKSPGWLGQLLFFGVTIFSVSLVLWAGLKFGYERYLTGQIDTLNTEIQKFNQQISSDDRNRIITFYSQLQNLKNLIANHALLTPMLSWLEGATLPQVTFTRLNYTPDTMQLGLNGVAKTAADLTAQLKLFENSPNVSQVSFSNITTNASATWAFDFTILFAKPFTVANSLSSQTP